MSDYDLVVVGGGLAGAAAALSFLESVNEAGRVAIIESGTREGGPEPAHRARPLLRLDRDHRLSRNRVDRTDEISDGYKDLDYPKLVDEVLDTLEFMQRHGVKLVHHD